MVSAILISTAVTGALLVAIVAAIAGEKRWRPVPAASEFRRRVGGGAGERGPVGGIVHSLATWELVFALLLVAVSGIVLLAASGTAGSVAMFAGFLGVLLVGFLVSGVYLFALEHGHSAALATAEAVVTFGGLVLLAIAAQLLTA